MKSIGDVVKIVGGCAFKSKDFSDVGEKVIKIKNISNNVVSVKGTDCVPFTIAEKTNAKFSIKPGAYFHPQLRFHKFAVLERAKIHKPMLVQSHSHFFQGFIHLEVVNGQF